MSKISLFLLTFLLFFLFSCEEAQRIWVSRELARCCNPWGDDLSMAEEGAASFLREKGFQIYDTRLVETDFGIDCGGGCCGCPSGNYVYVFIDEDKYDFAVQWAFY